MDAIRPRHLTAEPRRRDHLAGVAQTERVEGPPEPLEHVQIPLREHSRHRARLVHPDTVLAGERATRVEARLEDRLGELTRALGLTCLRVVEDEWVQVAVAGMEHVPHA